MKNNYYFSLGQNHNHKPDGVEWDKDGILQVVAVDMPTAIDFVISKTSNRWAEVYTEAELDLSYFPKGIIHKIEI